MRGLHLMVFDQFVQFLFVSLLVAIIMIVVSVKHNWFVFSGGTATDILTVELKLQPRTELLRTPKEIVPTGTIF